MFIKDKLSHFLHHSRSLHALLLVFLLAGSFHAVAQRPRSRVDQLSDEDVQNFYRKAQASGLSEVQIEQAAMSQGYTLDDIAKMRKRMAQIRTLTSLPQNQLPKESFKGSRGLPSDLSMRSDTLEVDSIRRDTTKRLRVFGASLFENAKMSFEPNLRIATPRNYIVGPDDEIRVDISGASTGDFQLKVSPDGTVKVPDLAPIFVSGLTIEQAEQRIIARLRQGGYQGLGRPGSGTSANVTLTNIRSIRVILVGEVVRPGTYTISSLGSVMNALYLAGGPNPETGSFRKINVVRGNRVVRTLDLYDFILRADQRDNIRLQDQDVIRVADYEAHVELTGQVRRPAIFEILPGETLKTLLAFAGGFGDDAYRASITLRRNTARERRIVTITEEQIATFVPKAGDKYNVGKILERYENRVQVAGAVMRPGDYSLEPGLETVRQLITRADGLRKDAFTNRATIVRERADMDRENLSFDLGKLMRGEINDIPLRSQDSLTVLSIRELREQYYVTIEGAVNVPDTIDFIANMSVADLIAHAGGFQEGAKPNLIEVARRIRQDSAGVRKTMMEIYRFSIDRNLQITPMEANPGNSPEFQLQPFDIVYVRTSPNYESQRQVMVYGEVMQPGNYAIANRQERIGDVIKRAGGLKPEAYMAGAQFRRNGQLIGNDLRDLISNPNVEENLLLQDRDTLFIPRRSEIITMQGAVLNPSSVSFKEDFKFDDYISEAGGFTENARQRKAYIVYPNGRKDRSHNFLFFVSRPRVDPGSTINVPFKPIDSNRLTAGERIGIFSLLATVSIALINVLLR
ncbi:SLBB domain-containing protein [Spirosoma fluviale]|uniref:Protein involved in polysaccharide export, contains SLBB domain of the beta-grasp fold n=1 Tax=Spirosoma fluviale TaxID=1597977 RepID=A0A286GI18_9BACT|nr:SLBB domain-containing protein [Spirosoma fluviale]SOD95122.1 protein involved in polysaccharide export, contains SLBB domain of the beta-grasp fold [Spirosoma fluviale]